MRALELLLTTIVLALFALMILFVSLQVVNRYGPGFSIPWTEELTRTAYVLLIFIGSALGVIRRGHIRVLSGVNLLPRRWRRILAALASLLSAAFFAVVAYGNYLYTVVNLDSVLPTAPWLSIGHIMAAVLTSSVLSALLFAFQAFKPEGDLADPEARR